MHLVGGAAVELEVARQRDRVGAALLQRLADVERLESGQRVDVVQHLAADRAEHSAALGRGERAPGAVERRAGGADRGIDVGCAAARDRRKRAAIGRVLERDRVAGVGAAPAAADQQLARIVRDVGFHGVSWDVEVTQHGEGRGPPAMSTVCDRTQPVVVLFRASIAAHSCAGI